MLCGSRSITRPAVFLTLRTVGREIVEVGLIGIVADLIKFIHRLIRTGESGTFFKLCIDFNISQQIKCRLILSDSVYIEIAVSVINKLRYIDFFFGAAADINITLYISVRIKVDVVIIKLTVFVQCLGTLERYLLPRQCVFDPQAEDTGGVFAEIIDISAGIRRISFDRSIRDSGGNILTWVIRLYLSGCYRNGGKLTADNDRICFANF